MIFFALFVCLFSSLAIVSVFYVWPTTIPLPVWHKKAKRSHTPVLGFLVYIYDL